MERCVDNVWVSAVRVWERLLEKVRGDWVKRKCCRMAGEEKLDTSPPTVRGQKEKVGV